MAIGEVNLPELHRPYIDQVMIKCPHCGCKVSLREVEKEEGLCPECGQPLVASSLLDDFDDDDEELDEMDSSDFDDEDYEDEDYEDEDYEDEEDDFDDFEDVEDEMDDDEDY